MKRFALLVLTVILVSAMIFSACTNDGEKDQTSKDISENTSSESMAPSEEDSSIVDESSENSEAGKKEDVIIDLKNGHYIITQELDVTFDIENASMCVVEQTPVDVLTSNITFENGIMTVAKERKNESGEYESIISEDALSYEYTLNNSLITSFKNDVLNIAFEYDAESRLSKIVYNEDYSEYTFNFSYNEKGIMTVLVEDMADLKLHGYDGFYEILTSYDVTEISGINGELVVKTNSTISFAVKELSKEEYEMYIIWKLYDFACDLKATADRGFFVEY